MTDERGTPRAGTAATCVRGTLMTWVGAATGCLAGRAPAAAAAPGGPGGAPTVLAALLTAAPAGTLAGLAGAGAGRAIAKRDGAPAGDAVRLAAAALMAGAALAPLGAATPLVSAAAALLLLKGALRDPEGSRLGATAAAAAALAGLAPVVHFAATVPGVTADHVRYGLEAPTLLGSPEAWGLRPAWSAESQDLARTASWSAWWATMRQAAAEAATTDVVLSPARNRPAPTRPGPPSRTAQQDRPASIPNGGQRRTDQIGRIRPSARISCISSAPTGALEMHENTEGQKHE